MMEENRNEYSPPHKQFAVEICRIGIACQLPQDIEETPPGNGNAEQAKNDVAFILLAPKEDEQAHGDACEKIGKSREKIIVSVHG
jgi:hypothetical protein